MASVCDKYCDGCVYRGIVENCIPWCSYYFETNKRRPCPAGKGCTVKDTGKRRKGWRKEEDDRYKKRKAEYERFRKQKQIKTKQIKTVVCDICGKEFRPSTEHRRHCSDACATRARTRRTNEYRKRRKANEEQAKSAVGEV